MLWLRSLQGLASQCVLFYQHYGKVSLVIELVIAIIINQIDVLQRKGIKALALENAAGTKQKSVNYRTAFNRTHNEPTVAFCTPEYIFGTESSSTCIGTVGRFRSLLEKKRVHKCGYYR